jgi:hypothetical protein
MNTSTQRYIHAEHLLIISNYCSISEQDHFNRPQSLLIFRIYLDKWNVLELVSKELNRAPTLLTSKRTRVLPVVIHKRKHNRLPSCRLGDQCHSCGLIIWAWACNSVARACTRPSSLKIDTVFTCAERVYNSELRGDEITGLIGGNIRVEERVNVTSYDIHDLTEDIDIFLPNVKGFSGGARTGVPCARECGFARGDERSELAGGSVFGEYSLVTDNNQLDEVPLTPGNDVSDLLLSSRAAGGGDEDT